MRNELSLLWTLILRFWEWWLSRQVLCGLIRATLFLVWGGGWTSVWNMGQRTGCMDYDIEWCVFSPLDHGFTYSALFLGALLLYLEFSQRISALPMNMVNISRPFAAHWWAWAGTERNTDRGQFPENIEGFNEAFANDKCPLYWNPYYWAGVMGSPETYCILGVSWMSHFLLQHWVSSGHYEFPH